MKAISEQDFLKIYDQYADAIFRYCLVRVRNKEEAMDLTQEVFMRTWRYIAQGERIEYIKAFLYRVARNALINAVSKQQAVSLDELVENGFEPVADGHTDAEMKFTFQKAMRVLEQLDEKYREAVTLRYISQLSVQEIASIAGESENVVSVRIHRGLQQLRTLMQ